jgi:hypothetical protein
LRPPQWGQFRPPFPSGGGSPGSKVSASATPVATTTKAKKKAAPKSARGPAGPKGATGATGPVGATGPAGPAGAKGENGAAGTNGTNGSNGEKGEKGAAGESVKSESLPVKPGAEHCEEGGSEFTAAEGKKTYACNGEKGVIHPGETLPAEASEYGTWSLGPIEQAAVPTGYAGGRYLKVPVASFAIPLAARLPEEDVHYINENGEEATDSGPVSGTPAECKGNAEKPTAEPGNFCVYAYRESGVKTKQENILTGGNLQEGAGTTGAMEVFIITASAAEAFGTWAVTAPAGS